MNDRDCISRQGLLEAMCDFYCDSKYPCAIKCEMVRMVEDFPPVQPEKSTTAEKSQLAEEKSTRKLIYLDDAIDAVMNTEPVFDSQSLEPFQKTKDVINALEAFPSAQPSEEYEKGWKDGQNALREEMWEDERDRLD